MKSKGLLWGGLAAGLMAVVVFLLGWIFFWTDDLRGYHHDLCEENSYGHAGMMGGYGVGGMMGGGMMRFDGMMGGNFGPADSVSPPLTFDQAREAAVRYIDNRGDAGLKVAQITEFTNGFYARVQEQDTGAGAYELWIERSTGAAAPEPGPSIIWNTKYGIMSGYGGGDAAGMMGGSGSTGMMGGGSGNTGRPSITTDMPVKGDEAKGKAQRYLDAQFPGAKAGEPQVFYGYYTFEFDKDGRVLGMLSIDGYYGQAWFHSWLGAYLDQKSF
jgi:hypothetical protein